jgi:hypothetical protein
MRDSASRNPRSAYAATSPAANYPRGEEGRAHPSTSEENRDALASGPLRHCPAAWCGQSRHETATAWLELGAWRSLGGCVTSTACSGVLGWSHGRPHSAAAPPFPERACASRPRVPHPRAKGAAACPASIAVGTRSMHRQCIGCREARNASVSRRDVSSGRRRGLQGPPCWASRPPRSRGAPGIRIMKRTAGWSWGWSGSTHTSNEAERN